jgi:hypothetical protein
MCHAEISADPGQQNRPTQSPPITPKASDGGQYPLVERSRFKQSTVRVKTSVDHTNGFA